MLKLSTKVVAVYRLVGSVNQVSEDLPTEHSDTVLIDEPQSGDVTALQFVYQ